jgi:hypothetical protein
MADEDTQPGGARAALRVQMVAAKAILWTPKATPKEVEQAAAFLMRHAAQLDSAEHAAIADRLLVLWDRGRGKPTAEAIERDIQMMNAAPPGWWHRQAVAAGERHTLRHVAKTLAEKHGISEKRARQHMREAGFTPAEEGADQPE